MGLTGIVAVTGLGLGLTANKIQLENITPSVSVKTAYSTCSCSEACSMFHPFLSPNGLLR